MAERLHAPFWYYGGKGNMVAKLLRLVPPGGRPYVEPYCGAASLFFAREPAPVEVLNDLDEEIVNVFRVLQDRRTFEELRHRLMYTPYALAEFRRALEVDETADPVTRAWATMVKLNMGMGGRMPRKPSNWGRAFTHSGGIAYTASQWLMRLFMLDAWHWRLMRVQIDCRDALEVIRYWDNEDAVFYVDPPYHPDTLRDKNAYKHMPDPDHYVRLVETLLQCRGAVVLSGYAHPVFQPLEEVGWERIDFPTACHAAGKTRNSGLQGRGATLRKVPRVESVWRNPKAVELCKRLQTADHRLQNDGRDGWRMYARRLIEQGASVNEAYARLIENGYFVEPRTYEDFIAVLGQK